jgi:hypothetical protein
VRPTVPLRADVLDAVPTAPMPAADQSLPVPSQPVMSQTLMSTAPPMPAMAPSPFSPNAVSGSNPFSQTGSVHAQMQSPFGTTGSVSAHAAPVARKRPVVVWVLVAAALVGVVLGLALGLGGSKKQDKPADEGSAVAMVSIDAAPAVVAVDAAVPMAVDAEIPVAVDAAAPAVDAPVKAEHHPEKKPPEDLAAMKPAEAVTACAASTSLFAANPVTCTVAACKAHELSRAKRWLASVPSAKRGSVTSACPALAPKVDNSEACKRDPLACQH